MAMQHPSRIPIDGIQTIPTSSSLSPSRTIPPPWCCNRCSFVNQVSQLTYCAACSEQRNFCAEESDLAGSGLLGSVVVGGGYQNRPLGGHLRRRGEGDESALLTTRAAVLTLIGLIPEVPLPGLVNGALSTVVTGAFAVGKYMNSPPNLLPNNVEQDSAEQKSMRRSITSLMLPSFFFNFAFTSMQQLPNVAASTGTGTGSGPLMCGPETLFLTPYCSSPTPCHSAFPPAGACTGAMVGAVAGKMTDRGVFGGAGLGLVAGAVVSVELLEAAHAIWRSARLEASTNQIHPVSPGCQVADREGWVEGEDRTQPRSCHAKLAKKSERGVEGRGCR